MRRRVTRHDVGENHVGLGAVDPAAGEDLTAEPAQPVGERVGDPLRPATREAPAVDVGGGAEEEANSPLGRLSSGSIECAAAGEERSSLSCGTGSRASGHSRARSERSAAPTGALGGAGCVTEDRPLEP